MPGMRLTRIGGPTVFVELDGWRILVDPTFDPPGRRYAFALGTSSVKTRGPAVGAAVLGPVDLVLVSHDHHADNLDDAGRALLADAAIVVTTESGAVRLGLPHTIGLRDGETREVSVPGRPPLRVTATPCRHGPPLTRAIVGDVIGFAVRRAGESQVALWATGDTVRHRALNETARHLDVDVMIVNAGGVGFGLTGPLRYTMTGKDAVRLVAETGARAVLPAHIDGWSHFRDGAAGMQAALDAAPAAVRDRFLRVADGEPVEV